MKKFLLTIVSIISAALVSAAEPFVIFTPSNDAVFTVAENGAVAAIYMAADELEGVKIAARDLQQDIRRVTGIEANLTECTRGQSTMYKDIVVGTIAQPLVQEAAKQIGLDLTPSEIGAGHQAWSANLFSTIGDMFPKSTIATITGIGAMAGGLGSMLVQRAAGSLFTYAENAGEAFSFFGFTGKPAGYFVMFCFCGLAYIVGWCIMKVLVPCYMPVEAK